MQQSIHTGGFLAVLRVGRKQILIRFRVRFGYRVFADKLIEQRAFTVLRRNGQHRVACRCSIVPQEILHVDDTGVVNTLLTSSLYRVRIAEIRRIRVAERTQQEHRVHLRGALAGRIEGRPVRAIRQTVAVQILHIRLFPSLEIGKRCSIRQRLGLSLLAEQTHQHDSRFRPGRRAVKIVAVLRALKQTHFVQRIRTIRIICRKGRSGQHSSGSRANTDSA